MNRKSLLKHLVPGCIAAFAALALPQNASAQAFIVNPTSATASSSASGYSATRLIDGSGLSPNGTDVETNDPIPDPYPSHGTGGGTDTVWRSGTVVGTSVTFTLGDAYDLTGIHLWNYNEVFNGNPETSRGMAETNVLVSTDNGGSFNLAQTFTFAIAPGSAAYEGDDYAFTDMLDIPTTLTGVTHVRFTTVTSHGANNLIGLSEVRFTAVPEPTTFAMLFGGVGRLALVRRRRIG